MRNAVCCLRFRLSKAGTTGEAGGVRSIRVWKRLLGVDDRTVIEGMEWDDRVDGVVVHVRPRRPLKQRLRCGLCGQPAPRYDAGEGRRRWRGIDLGTVKVWLEADAPRVSCREHRVTVAAVPWARHAAGFTREFEEQAAWLATHCSKSAITLLLRIAWRTVGAVISRVVAERSRAFDPLEGLRRIGIDEVAHRKGQRYLTAVVDHDSGRQVWAAPAQPEDRRAFFDALGADRCAADRACPPTRGVDRPVK